MQKAGKYIVIDDDTTNNLICEFTIKKFDGNATVVLFKEPEKALEALERNGNVIRNSNERSIIFLDINMPTMSGFEWLDEFQKFPVEIKEKFIIYVLTSSIEDFTNKAKVYPFVSNFISKPLKVSHLTEIFKKEIAE